MKLRCKPRQQVHNIRTQQSNTRRDATLCHERGGVRLLVRDAWRWSICYLWWSLRLVGAASVQLNGLQRHLSAKLRSDRDPVTSPGPSPSRECQLRLLYPFCHSTLLVKNTVKSFVGHTAGFADGCFRYTQDNAGACEAWMYWSCLALCVSNCRLGTYSSGRHGTTPAHARSPGMSIR